MRDCPIAGQPLKRWQDEASTNRDPISQEERWGLVFSGEFKVRSLLPSVKRGIEGDSKARHNWEVPDFRASSGCFGFIRTLTKRDLRVLGVLVECNTLLRQITALCAQAERESQISR